MFDLLPDQAVLPGYNVPGPYEVVCRWWDLDCWFRAAWCQTQSEAARLVMRLTRETGHAHSARPATPRDAREEGEREPLP